MIKAQAVVGQIWASTNKTDRESGHNQRRAVLALTTKQRYVGYSPYAGTRYEQVPVAVLSCEGNVRCSKVALDADGSIKGHRLVSEPDPRIEALANAFAGIPHRQPYDSYYDRPNVNDDRSADLRQEVYEALLRPCDADGKQNPRIEVVLHPDALAAIGARILELGAVVEQNALAQASQWQNVLVPSDSPAFDSDPSGPVWNHAGLPQPDADPDNDDRRYDVMEP